MDRWHDRLTSGAQSLCQRFGLDIRRFSTFGINPYADVSCIMGTRPAPPTVFDVGANGGQTVAHVRGFFPDAVIHCFEPGASAFTELSGRYRRAPGIHLNNVALGARGEERTLLDHETSRMSSFLPLGTDGWGSIVGSTLVSVTTLDEYVQDRSVPRIDLLKIDTQGFEMEVLAGATGSLSGKLVEFVLAEVNFASLYSDTPSLHDITSFLGGHGFELVSLYNMRHLRHRAGWADVLFATAPRR